ncbi:MAG: T9SS type A sorting domain-containing protein, partial [Ignavibacteria bacterium]|nr:T9SS type A sorting domain-containing protein [Ignavibacteria bacterium]
FNNSHVFKSTNSGNNWIDITNNLPNVPHQCIVIDPLYPNNIYVGNDLSVYVSTNGGQTWGEYRTGMPYSLVFDLTISYPNRKLRATTHGNGVWQRNLVSIPSKVISNENIPDDFNLEQNYPNPFNQTTVISFQLPVSSRVNIRIFDITGKEIETILDEYKNAGIYKIFFNAKNLSSGIYFYQMLVNEKIFIRKMIFIK